MKAKSKRKKEYDAGMQAIYREGRKPKQEIVDRECLRCGKAFKAQGRFNRVCALCKQNNQDWHYAGEFIDRYHCYYL